MKKIKQNLFGKYFGLFLIILGFFIVVLGGIKISGNVVGISGSKLNIFGILVMVIGLFLIFTSSDYKTPKSQSLDESYSNVEELIQKANEILHKAGYTVLGQPFASSSMDYSDRQKQRLFERRMISTPIRGKSRKK